MCLVLKSSSLHVPFIMSSGLSGFDIDMNLKWFHGKSKPKKNMIIVGNKKLENDVLFLHCWRYTYM